VTASSGWNPFSPASGGASEHFVAGPFTRLARTHALSTAGDALIALSLAGSVFFSVPVGEARPRVALYLLLTMAPFAIVAPLIGPAIDRARGGRRWMIVASAALRMIVAVMMMGHLDSLLLFPEAFTMLVLGKGYQVAKSAVVPTTVQTDTELVEANAKLSILTGLAGVVAGIPGGLLLVLGGPTWTLGLAAVVFSAAAIAGLKLPNESIATEPADAAEREELRSALIRLSASAMGLMRGVVGFLAFLLAFAVRGSGAPDWYLGVAIGASVAGSFIGSFVAPRVRATTDEEDMLIGALGLCAVFGLLCAWMGGLLGLTLMSLAVGFCANTAKLAFDSLVQRDAPDANRGRSFASFETRFQMVWVGGALIPVVVPIPARMGFFIIAVTMTFAVASYVVGRRRVKETVARTGSTRPPGRAPAEDAPGPQRKRRTNTRGRSERPATDPGPADTRRPRPPRPPDARAKRRRRL
jgi:MFS family permease